MAGRRAFPTELQTQTLWVRVGEPWLSLIVKESKLLAKSREETALDLIIEALNKRKSSNV